MIKIKISLILMILGLQLGFLEGIYIHLHNELDHPIITEQGYHHGDSEGFDPLTNGAREIAPGRSIQIYTNWSKSDSNKNALNINGKYGFEIYKNNNIDGKNYQKLMHLGAGSGGADFACGKNDEFTCVISRIYDSNHVNIDIIKGKTVKTEILKDLSNDLQLKQIALLGTHDTGTYGFNKTMLRQAFRAQDENVEEQLNNGARVLDIRADRQGG